jgi:hypothetical protein
MTLNPQQFVRVFRGLAGVEPDQVDYEKLGMHWSANAHVASDFTQGQGSIIEGKVNKQHLMTPDHPDWKEFQVRYQVFGPNSKEREHTVLSGSPVDITQVHHVYDEDEEPLAFKPNESYDELSRKLPKRGTA